MHVFSTFQMSYTVLSVDNFTRYTSTIPQQLHQYYATPRPPTYHLPPTLVLSRRASIVYPVSIILHSRTRSLNGNSLSFRSPRRRRPRNQTIYKLSPAMILLTAPMLKLIHMEGLACSETVWLGDGGSGVYELSMVVLSLFEMVVLKGGVGSGVW